MHDPVEKYTPGRTHDVRFTCGHTQVWSATAHGAMPISLPVQRRIPVQRCMLRAESWALWQAIILLEPGVTFVSDCATVLRGLERGPKRCTAAGRKHADVWSQILDCFRNIGDEAHIDSVTKCKAHLSRAQQAKLDEAGRFTTGNERADEMAKEGARDDSFQSCETRTREVSKRVRGSFIFRVKGRRTVARRGHTPSRMGRER